MLQNVQKLFDLRSDLESFDNVHTAIENGVSFRGTNLWILVFATVIASVGLNINSTAVIIGAMLISPLMGPINAIGYSVATHDFGLLTRALKNFSFAVGASLVASMIYFYITPVSAAHSELLARTSPSIYDVLIAFLGGFAGIIAIISKQKGNVIPGVAIATALMPPLCTAGYGLGTGQLGFFFGAFYLFTINTVFIAIASLLTAKALKFPVIVIIDPVKRKFINGIVLLVIACTLLPSIYLGYLLVKKEKFLTNASNFTKDISFFQGSYLLKSEADAKNGTITLLFGGNSIGNTAKQLLSERARAFNLPDVKLIFTEGLTLDYLRKNLGSSLNTDERDKLIMLLNANQKKIDSLTDKSAFGSQLLKEIKPLFPQIVSCAYTVTSMFGGMDSTGNEISKPVSLIVLGVNNKALKESEKVRIKEWLQSRIESTNILVLYEHFPVVRYK